MNEFVINILHAATDYRGDHSADVLVAVTPRDGETVADLVERTLGEALDTSRVKYGPEKGTLNWSYCRGDHLQSRVSPAEERTS